MARSYCDAAASYRCCLYSAFPASLNASARAAGSAGGSGSSVSIGSTTASSSVSSSPSVSSSSSVSSRPSVPSELPSPSPASRALARASWYSACICLFDGSIASERSAARAAAAGCPSASSAVVSR